MPGRLPARLLLAAMACKNKLLLVGLLAAGLHIACWAVVFFLPSCPIPPSDGGSTAGLSPSPTPDPSTDTGSFCVPDWDYLPHGTFHFFVGGFLGWIALNLYSYFAADDEATRAAVARKLLAVAVLLVGDILVGSALISAVPDMRGGSCADLGAGLTCHDVVLFLLGALVTCADFIIYYRFFTRDGDEAAFRTAKKAGYLSIRNEPEAGGAGDNKV